MLSEAFPGFLKIVMVFPPPMWYTADRNDEIPPRGGARCPGFDYGNSPSSIPPEAVRGRRVIHTSSAGTQGLTRAVHAEERIAGSLVNAAAVAAYIRQRKPGRFFPRSWITG